MAEKYTPIFNEDMARRLVVSANEGTDLADTQFSKDIQFAPYGYLVDKYGQEVADSRRSYFEQRAEVKRIEDTNRSVGQIAGDTSIAVPAGFVNVVGSMAGAALAAAGEVDQIFMPGNTAVSDYAVNYTKTTSDIVNYMKSFQSQELQDSRAISGIQAELEAQDNLDQYAKDTKGREGTFVDDLAWFGRGTLNNLSRIGTNGAVAGDVIAEGIGSLGPSAKLASVASKLVTGSGTYKAAMIANNIAATQGTRIIAAGAEAVNRGAIATAVGVSEASGVYSQTVNEVLGMSDGELRRVSPEYVKMVDEDGITPDDAKSTLAANAGLESFKTSFPMAAGLGIIAGKFEAMPIASFRGSGFIGGLRSVGAQTFEEGGQGLSGQYATNTAIRDTGVDPARGPMLGGPEALATGMIAGAGMAGVMSAPAAIGGTPKAVAGAVRDVASTETAKKLAVAAASGIASGLDAASTVTSAAVNTKAGQATLAGGRAVIKKANEVAAPIVEATNEKIADYNDRPDREAQTENLKTIGTIAKLSSDELTTPIDPNQEDDALTLEMGRKQAVKDIAKTPSKSVVPDTFKDGLSDKATTIDKIGAIATKLGEKGVRVNKLSDSDILYAAQEIATLENSISDLPSVIQTEVKKIINSADFSKIKNRATQIDLNQTQDASKPITQATVQETKVVASTNPVNVNPAVVDKILAQDDRKDLTSNDIKIMKVAKRIAQAILSRADAIVNLKKEQNVQLSILPEYKEGKKKLPLVEAVSRDIAIGTGNTKSPSVSDFASNIIQGVQSKNKTVIIDGVATPIEAVTKHFGNFAQHMINKVKALNISYDQRNEKGVGTSQVFDNLGPNRKLRPGRLKDNSTTVTPVTYQSHTPNGVALAREVHADAVALVEVYNALAEAFPENFPNGKLSVPELRGFETQTMGEKGIKISGVDAAVKNGISTIEVSEDGKVVPFKAFALSVDGKTAEVGNVERGFNARKGIGFDAYVALGLELASRGIILQSTQTLLKDGKKLWERLEKEGYAERDANSKRYIFVNKTNQNNTTTTKSIPADVQSVIDKIQDRLKGKETTLVIETRTQSSMAGYSKNRGTISVDVDRLAADFENGLTYIDGNGETTSEQKVEVFKNIDVKHFREHILKAGLATYVQFVIEHELQHARQLNKGEVYPKDLMDPKAIAMEQDANRAAFKAIGYTPVSINNDVPVSDRNFNNLHPKFGEAFQPNNMKVTYANGVDLLDAVNQDEANSDYVEFVSLHLNDLMDRANERLATMKTNKTDTMTIKERILAGEDTTQFRRNKNTILVDQTTGEYDPALLSIASVAVLDWLSGVRTGNPQSLNDTLEDMGLTYSMVSEENIRDIMFGVSPREVAEGLSKDIVRMWGMKLNRDVPMVDARGAIEGLVKELLESLIDLDTGLIELKKVPYFDAESGKLVSQSIFSVFPMMAMQKTIGMKSQQAVKKMLAPEEDIMPSIGSAPTSVDKTQSRGDVKLSKKERKALERMQNQGHGLVETFANLISNVGLDNLAVFLGKKDFSLLAEKHPLRASIVGKNLSIERDFNDAMSVIDAIKNASQGGKLLEVFYRVGISRVGRHQFKGINPQNNKILRALVTPTKATLNMKTKKHKDAFWLTVAQAADISGYNKVENQKHKFILDNIQEVFTNKYGDAVELMVEGIKSGKMDGAALVEAMGGTGEMQQLNAVFAVAQLQIATENDTLASFETTLSFELDGKTDGPGNMMSNFGQGVLSAQDYMNFKRVGLFLGLSDMTLNKFYGDGNQQDLYEVTSLKGQQALYTAIAGGNIRDKARLHAMARFASAFGDLKIVDGQYVMTRNTSKNPMTKTVYGSSERGVGQGLANDIMMEMYTQLIANPEGIVEYPGGHENFVRDFELAFDTPFPKVDWNKSYLDKKSVDIFTKLVTETLGKVLSKTAKETIGDEITRVSDTLVLMTAFQTEFLTAKFNQLLDELVAKRVEQGKIKTNTQGKPDRSSITQRDYDEVVAQIREYSPIYANGMQTLDIGNFAAKDSGIKLSSSMSEGFQMGSSMIVPTLSGVKVIPYITIGRGDAMMMNWIYGAETAPDKTLTVFDGIDMPIDKIAEYAQQINEAVLKNWEADVLGDVVRDITGFMEKTSKDGDLLADAWNRAFEAAQKKNTTASAKTPESLIDDVMEMHRKNQARKTVFKRIGVSVDHMGGSDTAFVRTTDGREYTLGEINDMITQELNKEIKPTGDTTGNTGTNTNTINIWAGTQENAELSNLATRPFKYEGISYISVEHAYQTLKSGKFDKETYEKYRNTRMQKIGGNKGTDKNNSIALMEKLIVASFEQNPKAMAILMATGNATLTHIQDRGIWAKEFPRILMDIRQRSKNSGKNRPPVDGDFSNLVVTDANTIIDGLLRETRNPLIAHTIRVLKKAGIKTRIVVGSAQEVSDWYQENIGDMQDTLKQDKKGIYDPVNDVMLITDNNHETLVHELIHAATFQIILDYYEGQVDMDGAALDAVVRLEILMEEFMDMDFSNSSQAVQDAVNSAKAQILSYQVNENSFSYAAALNEFMSWTLSNESLMKELNQRPTTFMAKMSKFVRAMMQRLLGGIKSDMLSNIQFNTELIIDPASVFDVYVDKDSIPPDSNDDGDLTPTAQNMTNFWIDLAKQRLEEARNSIGTSGARLAQISDYRNNAQKALDTLNFGGFNLSAYQQETFKAIHMVLALEMRLDPQSSAALNVMFDYVTDNLKPEMFGDINPQDRYSAVMDIFGATKNDEGVSDAIAVLLALSQTSKGFRAAIDQLPTPESIEGVSTESLNDFLGSVTGMLMNKAIGSIDVSNQSVSETLDQLSKSILLEESDKEFRILSGLMQNIDKADAFLGGALKMLAGYTEGVNSDIRQSNRSNLTKLIVASIASATAFLDQDRADIQAEGLKRVTHMGTNLDWAVPAREFVAEIVGTDQLSRNVVAMLDKATYSASAVRQNYREDLPVILQDAFDKSPTAEQWRATHKIMGRTDFAVVYDESRPDQSFELLKDENIIDNNIKQIEGALRSNLSKSVVDTIIEKGKQLADYMNGNGAGHQLWRNAYAINMMSGDYTPKLTAEIDQLISLYALKGSDPEMRKETFRMYENDPIAMQNLIVYMKGLNKEEDSKSVSDMALLNGYKGYIPDHGQQGAKVIIARDDIRSSLEKKGYKRVADATSDNDFSIIDRGYYVTTTKQTGTYSQGVMQIIQDTYRGVDATTGLSVNGATSGLLSGSVVVSVTDALNKMTKGIADNKEALLPVYDEDGVVYYERVINPDILEKYTAPKSNLALMLGAWAGRQVEEKFGQQYNQGLIDELYRIHDTRGQNDDDLFVNLPEEAKKLRDWNDATRAERRKMKKPDQIFIDSWNVISPQTKKYIEQVFGEGKFYVRKDQMNLALGYRDPSIIDMWTGNTRVPEALQEGVQAITSMFMGKKAMSSMAAVESGVQGVVSTAKDIIVVRSLVVPYMNTQANVVQLSTRGIPVKQQFKGYKNKLAEIEQFNINRKKLIELETRIQLAGIDKNRVKILEGQRQVVLDQNARFSIAPMIDAGAYKNISEGITELDVDLSSGRIGEWVEMQINKLPTGVQTVAKYGLLSKDTAIYKGANKAVQYGDFIAKSIYYDHLIEKGMKPEDAMMLVNEEFVNFSVLPGRTRQYLEGIGATWFLSFKIRIMKIAMNQIRENPARSLLLAATVADFGSPQADNLASVIADDRIGYALGWDMLFGSGGLNPWINLTNG